MAKEWTSRLSLPPPPPPSPPAPPPPQPKPPQGAVLGNRSYEQAAARASINGLAGAGAGGEREEVEGWRVAGVWGSPGRGMSGARPGRGGTEPGSPGLGAGGAGGGDESG
ncbi:hypothetical protein ZWY2020_022378 [Hordeum vulgare]|nr:hypothetical protein ZWY2020_022378 [Hordeum vulgare]